jgi:hypothetical protein
LRTRISTDLCAGQDLHVQLFFDTMQLCIIVVHLHLD